MELWWSILVISFRFMLIIKPVCSLCLHCLQYKLFSLFSSSASELQLVSNDKFLSVEHRVVANKKGPRISVAIFLNPSHHTDTQYGPIKELLSEEDPEIYQTVSIKDYIAYFYTKGLNGESVLSHFTLPHMKQKRLKNAAA